MRCARVQGHTGAHAHSPRPADTHRQTRTVVPGVPVLRTLFSQGSPPRTLGEHEFNFVPSFLLLSNQLKACITEPQRKEGGNGPPTRLLLGL